MTIRRRVRHKIPKSVFYAIYSQGLTYGENGLVNDKNRIVCLIYGDGKVNSLDETRF